MKCMSFAHTTDAILARTKTVTRRLGWMNLQPGTLLRAVRQAQGLKKGEKVETLAIIRVVDVRREHLFEITQEDVDREGFAETCEEFVLAFCRTFCCTPLQPVTRIEFEYVEVCWRCFDGGLFGELAEPIIDCAWCGETICGEHALPYPFDFAGEGLKHCTRCDAAVQAHIAEDIADWARANERVAAEDKAQRAAEAVTP